MNKIYPSWDEVKDETEREDLYLFIDCARDGKDINDAIQEWIEENYEYTLEPDPDEAYDEWVDEQIMNDEYQSYDYFVKEKTDESK